MIVSKSYNENVMAQCPNCLRKFLEDRLVVHLKSCTVDTPHKPPPGAVKQDLPVIEKKEQKTSFYETEKTFSRPKALMCHIW